MPVKIKMVVLGKSDSKVQLRIDKLHTDTRVELSVVGWNFENSQLALVEGQLLNSPCIELDSLSDPHKSISSCELECCPISQDGDSNGAQPSAVVISVVGDKESIHLELFVAEEVEDGTVHTLEGVAEQTTSRQPDGKVWVRPNTHLSLIVCKDRRNGRIMMPLNRASWCLQHSPP